MKAFSKFVFKSFGWRYYLTVELPAKCVICVAPHTSNWDFFIGKLYYHLIGNKPYFLMKKEWFFFPLNNLLKSIGGIPVDRSKKSALTDQMIHEFKQRRRFHLAIAPEGTRKKTKDWKSGFYYIALGAKVPIALAHIDYKKKEIGISKIFHPMGNAAEDILEIKEYYAKYNGEYPKKTST